MKEWKPTPLKTRSIVKACNPICDICGKHRSGYISHAKCSKLRQKRRLASLGE